MLITRTRAEIAILIDALQVLPVEGRDINEVIGREYTRQLAITKLRQSLTPIPPTHHTDTPTHHTDTPTTIVDSYWGMRLGIIQG